MVKLDNNQYTCSISEIIPNKANNHKNNNNNNKNNNNDNNNNRFIESPITKHICQYPLCQVLRG